MVNSMPASQMAVYLGSMWMSVMFLLGKLRDLLEGTPSKRTRKGYAPIREKEEDFYNRRLYARIRDCWNRPISSAPDSWIDVMERTDLTCTSGNTPIKLLGTIKRCLNLGSYNYLGFANKDPYCTPRVLDTLEAQGVSACSSRATGGTMTVHEELEAEVARYIGKEAAVVFGMGYATNSAVIPALVGKGCLILSDQLNHASIVAGARAAGARVKVFKHNNVKHLEHVLRRSIAEGQPRTHRPWKKVLIIVEGIYSMEGETCKLADIVAVKKKYGAYLYLDEAHSIGAMGKTGRGCVEHWGVDPKDVDVMMGTFTKSFGSCGGYIGGSQDLVQHLKRHGPGHLYASSMAPAAAQQCLSALKLLMGEDGSNRGQLKVQQLHDNSNYFRQHLLDMGMHVLGDWDSPVMPIMIYNPGKLAIFSRLALESNLATVVVGFPATELLAVRARVCISAAHTKQDLDYALRELDYVADMCMIKYGAPQSFLSRQLTIGKRFPLPHSTEHITVSQFVRSGACVGLLEDSPAGSSGGQYRAEAARQQQNGHAHAGAAAAPATAAVVSKAGKVKGAAAAKGGVANGVAANGTNGHAYSNGGSSIDSDVDVAAKVAIRGGSKLNGSAYLNGHGHTAAAAVVVTADAALDGVKAKTRSNKAKLVKV